MIGFLYSLACNSSHHHLPAVPDVDAWCGWTAVQTHALQVVPVAIARCYVGQHGVYPVCHSIHALQAESRWTLYRCRKGEVCTIGSDGGV